MEIQIDLCFFRSFSFQNLLTEVKLVIDIDDYIELAKKRNSDVRHYIPCDGCFMEKCTGENKQLIKWLSELKAYKSARAEIGNLTQTWEEGAGIAKCIKIIDTHIESAMKEVTADDE